MAQVRSWAGLDVHARSVLAVTVDGASGEIRSRRLAGTGVGCVVAAPGKIERPAQDRVKTDQRVRREVARYE